MGELDQESTSRTGAGSSGDGHGSVAAVDRALDILEAFTSSRAEYGLTELARMTGIPKATTHRLLTTLARRDYVSAENGRYRLGTRILHLSYALASSLDIRQTARPYLVELRDLTNETVHLAIRDRDAVIYLEKIESHHKVRPHTWIGYRAHLHSTALGRAMLAYESDEVIAQLVGGGTLERLTPRTIVDVQELLNDLDRVRQNGYAIDDEEDTVGMRCIASPIKDHTGRVRAAVGVAGPVDRMLFSRMQAIIPDTMRTARTISAQLGWQDNLDYEGDHYDG